MRDCKNELLLTSHHNTNSQIKYQYTYFVLLQFMDFTHRLVFLKRYTQNLRKGWLNEKKVKVPAYYPIDILFIEAYTFKKNKYCYEIWGSVILNLWSKVF